MKLVSRIMAISLLPFLAMAEENTFWGYENASLPFQGILWKAPLREFSADAYANQVEQLLRQFEETTGRPLVPGEKGRAGLKIYTDSGLGLETPKPLVRATLAALERRGFRKEQLFLLDARESLLRDAGYLPPLSRVIAEGSNFEGVRVYALDRSESISPDWFYESPLPQEFTSPLGKMMLQTPLILDPQEARKSYLPEPLLIGVDFWINLPVATHHPATGLSGALVNASLWNISNGTRFFSSPANAPVAVAEIASIPELKAHWALNLISLESFQYIAGPAFNANYTGSRAELWMSIDPVIMDANLLEVLNEARRKAGFRPFPPVPEFIEYSVQLGLGKGLVLETQPIQLGTGD